MEYRKYLKHIPIFLILISAVIALSGTIYIVIDVENIDHELLSLFIKTDLCLLGVMIVITVFKIAKLITQNTKKSKLRLKVILVFTFLSISPTITITIFSSLFFNYGIKSWFNQRVSQALTNSVTVAEAYLREHGNLLSTEALNLAQEITNQNLYDTTKLTDMINIQSELRNLTEVVILKDHIILAKSRLSFSIDFDHIPIEFLQDAHLGEIVVFTSNREEKVRALIKIPNYQSVYLLISKPIDKKIIKHLASTKIAVNSYLWLQKTINNIQLQFFLLFILISLLLLLFSTWRAIHFANELLYPIIELAYATKKVGTGNLDITVIPKMKGDEISDLAHSFNHMTKTLREQRDKLITTHKDLSKRHIFIQTILSELSSGVIVLDNSEKVTLMNNVAYKIFGQYQPNIEESLFSAIPEIKNMITICPGDQYIEKSVQYIREGKEAMHLLIRASAINYQEASIDGYIITFDDISKLVSAQKALMWSEVAKRIAHEIKNPITPIYLATEQLEKQINKSQSSFIKYLDIIKRNIHQLSFIINEFVHFARLPNPIFAENDIVDILRSAIASLEVVFPNIRYYLNKQTQTIMLKCDRNQISAALDNIIRNACEAIQNLSNPQITINANIQSNYINITIEDNGPGFPKEIISYLTEPYVTTKSGGTGLGLAIVKKIIDEHNGIIEFKNIETHGGKVIILLPIK